MMNLAWTISFALGCPARVSNVGVHAVWVFSATTRNSDDHACIPSEILTAKSSRLIDSKRFAAESFRDGSQVLKYGNCRRTTP